MSRFTMQENKTTVDKISKIQERYQDDDTYDIGVLSEEEDAQVKNLIKDTRIEIKRATNITKSILTMKASKNHVRLRGGFGQSNEIMI